jgi:predicted nucleotidyltransferase
MAVVPNIGQLRERLAPLFADEKIEMVILFGSMATGAARAESDVDVAIRGTGPLDLVALTQ